MCTSLLLVRMNPLQSYFAQLPVKKYSKGEVIIQQGASPQCAYAVKRGIIKIYNLTVNGEEKSITYSLANEIFPVCWIFSKTKQALFYYQAYTDCELYVLNKESFEHHLRFNPRFTRALLDKQMNWYVNSVLQINALEQTKASNKLLHTFRNLCLRFGKDVRTDLVVIEIPLTQQELANLTGLTRETAAAELKKLKQQKVIVSNSKYYTVDTTLLNNLLDDEYNPGIYVSAQ